MDGVESRHSAGGGIAKHCAQAHQDQGQVFHRRADHLFHLGLRFFVRVHEAEASVAEIGFSEITAAFATDVDRAEKRAALERRTVAGELQHVATASNVRLARIGKRQREGSRAGAVKYVRYLTL